MRNPMHGMAIQTISAASPCGFLGKPHPARSRVRLAVHSVQRATTPVVAATCQPSPLQVRELFRLVSANGRACSPRSAVYSLRAGVELTMRLQHEIHAQNASITPPACATRTSRNASDHAILQIMVDTVYRVVPQPGGSADVELSNAGQAVGPTRNFSSLGRAYSWIDQDKERALKPPRRSWWPFRGRSKDRT